jgi:hypothetical protein
MVIWYILWPFGLFYGHLGCFGIFYGGLVYFVAIWYVATRKIWQPWCEISTRKKSKDRAAKLQWTYAGIVLVDCTILHFLEFTKKVF